MGSRHQGARRRVVLGREGGRAGKCQPAGAGEPGRPVACPRRVVPVGRRGLTPEGAPRFSCPLIVLSTNTDRGEKRGFASKDASVGCGRIMLQRRAGRAGRRGEEPKRESTTPRSARSCAPCVRCVHVRCGVRNGEARRLRAPRACVLLSVRVRSRRAGKAKKAQGPPAHHHHHTPRARACVRTCVRELRSKGATRLA